MRMAFEDRHRIDELMTMASTLGYRNRAGAPLTGVGRTYDVQLALRFLTAAQEVMQRVVIESPAVGTDAAARREPVVLEMAPSLPGPATGGHRRARPR